jgi:hypothetical protein
MTFHKIDFGEANVDNFVEAFYYTYQDLLVIIMNILSIIYFKFFFIFMQPLRDICIISHISLNCLD